MIVGATGVVVPEPDSEMIEVAVCGSLLVIVMLPELVPATVGEYVTFSETLAPGVTVLGVVIPVTPNGPALAESKEIVRLEPPTLLIFTVPLAVVPTVTLPKFRLVGVT